MSMTETIRRAVQSSKKSAYAISKETGLEAAALRRFMAKSRSLRLDKADILAEYLRLELKPKGKQRKGR